MPSPENQARYRVNASDLYGLFTGHSGKDRREPGGEHSFPQPGGPAGSDVSACGCDLERAPGSSLTPYLTQVDRQLESGFKGGGTARERESELPSSQPMTWNSEDAAKDLDSVHDGRFRCRTFRKNNAFRSMLSGRHGRCERAIHRPKVSIQRQLANEYRPLLATALHGTIRNQNADCNREVEYRPYLRKVGGRDSLPRVGG